MSLNQHNMDHKALGVGALWPVFLRAYNKMTLHLSGLFSVRTASGCIDNTLVLPVSPFLPDEKTLAFVATIHFVRGS
jgi:hypothetical protein